MYIQPSLIVGSSLLVPSVEANKLITNANLVETRAYYAQSTVGPVAVAHNAGNVTLLTYNLANNNVAELVIFRATVEFTATIDNVLSIDMRKNGVSLNRIARFTSIGTAPIWIEFPILITSRATTPDPNVYTFVASFSSGVLVTTANIHNITITHTQL